MEKGAKEIVAEAERLDIKDKAVLALSEVLFDSNMLSQIPKFRNLFLRVSFKLYLPESPCDQHIDSSFLEAMYMCIKCKAHPWCKNL